MQLTWVFGLGFLLLSTLSLRTLLLSSLCSMVSQPCPRARAGSSTSSSRGPPCSITAAYTLHWAGEDPDNADNAIVTVIVSVRCYVTQARTPWILKVLYI